ncbi:cell wall hydrolase/autolysin [Desulfurobacterium thermolithotrophum DSM 11699]|uniref:N-acetylmuramoyl-L-alanine amidase n=1 Tax=Desulfurobacterium thermolithotrophum (strain DSM 11699 / BSA) TaxID=868864 RepID=F0S3D5_DESTD|nr:N-acetylmuramoyl-L-alanine amidase [Desulfurobacterium thermolithotrophum]ADY73357.1 cell wall hydrolase/autolysin [Desulfurobacterium thermolithotrophum DSM 11699]
MKIIQTVMLELITMMNRREILKGFIGGFCFFPFLEEADASSISLIKRIRYSSNEERTRIVLDCTGKVIKRNIEPFLKGKTLWIKLKNVRANKIVKSLKSPLVSEVKVIPINKHVVKVKLVMKEPHKYKIFALKPYRGKPFRIVVDVFPDFIVTNCRLKTNKKRIVVIDPGHGGKDPGAVWPIRSKYPRIREKDITLSIALRVRRILKRYSDIKVIMTRTKDVYVPLLKRAEIAAKSCADAFVSIHADSMPHYPNWNGVTVFKASPALFAKAQITAKEVAKKVRICNDIMCWSISPLLLNMSTTITFVESSKLAEKIVNNLKAHVNDDLVNGIRDMKRNIVVLKTPGRPAVLVETGFLTNPLDRKRLVQNWYQEEIARGIAKGIRDYVSSLNQTAFVM